jgi:hypothetical protein
LNTQQRIKRKIEARIKSIVFPRIPNFIRREFEFPEGFKTVSLEMALNSRCSSDYFDDQTRFHWGRFDGMKKLSTAQIETILQNSSIPRITDLRVEILVNRNILTFTIDDQISGIQKDWAMVESGMQQQAIGLICATLGVGIKFRELGCDGGAISNSAWGNVKMRLDPAKPSYDGKYWCNTPPAGINGNLPSPSRDGNNTLLATISSAKILSQYCNTYTEHDISQLLWAARGRTPHLHNSNPWGMTIPTWAGEQKLTGVYLLRDNQLFEYVNMEQSRPTHSLSLLFNLDELQAKKIKEYYYPYQAFIILIPNEHSGRALWEIGYQLLNLLLQAHGLHIQYKAILVDEFQRSNLYSLKLASPVALLAL